MDQIRAVNAGKHTACVTIRHICPWDEGRHPEAFLQPLVAGARRRLVAAVRDKDSPVTDK